eukprot:scaffold76175_cov20-Tisochrysis_lutea.AAC.1
MGQDADSMACARLPWMLQCRVQGKERLLHTSEMRAREHKAQGKVGVPNKAACQRSMRPTTRY